MVTWVTVDMRLIVFAPCQGLARAVSAIAGGSCRALGLGVADPRWSGQRSAHWRTGPGARYLRRARCSTRVRASFTYRTLLQPCQRLTEEHCLSGWSGWPRKG